MKSTAHINIRVEAEYEEMLNELLRDEAKDAMHFNRSPMNKTQLIKTAIKEYYASRKNTSVANAYVDLIQNSMEPMMMSFFNTMNEKQTLLFKKLEGMSQKELLYMKLLMMGTDLKEPTDENDEVTEKLLEAEGGFEDAVNRKLQEYLSGNKEK